MRSGFNWIMSNGWICEHGNVLSWFRGLPVTYKTGSGLDDWIYYTLYIAPYTFTTQDYRQYKAIADLHTLQFTVTRSLWFSVFTSRILATDFITVSLWLQITHEVFFSQPNYLLAIILQLPIPKTRRNSIPLPPSSYLGKLAPPKLDSSLSTTVLFCSVLPNTSL
jgi:hypothetical protein